MLLYGLMPARKAAIFGIRAPIAMLNPAKAAGQSWIVTDWEVIRNVRNAERRLDAGI